MSRTSGTLQVAPTSSTRTVSRPTAEDIAFRAHEIFVQRGATPGRELDDWLQAERELTPAKKPASPQQQSGPSVVPLANPRSRR
ncbi:MAG: DUF2934 domain-containing protein [Candidatus Acidiferrum sp.]